MDYFEVLGGVVSFHKVERGVSILARSLFKSLG